MGLILDPGRSHMLCGDNKPSMYWFSLCSRGPGASTGHAHITELPTGGHTLQQKEATRNEKLMTTARVDATYLQLEKTHASETNTVKNK